YTEYIGRIAEARERAGDLGWAPEVAASYLVDVYTLRAYRAQEFARQILFWVSFIPAIDRILYAPQVPFASAYFKTLEDPDPLPASSGQSNNQTPRGKLVYKTLRALSGVAGMQRFLHPQLAGDPIRDAGVAVHGAPLDCFFPEGLGPSPPVDYR